jgi:hypothetical protein
VVVSPITPSLNDEMATIATMVEIVVYVQTLVTNLEGADLVVSPVATRGTTLGVVSPMALNLKSEEMTAIVTTLKESVAPGRGAVPTHACTTLEVVTPMTLDLKGEEMPTHATTPDSEGSDSDAAACPTSTNSLKPTEPTTNTG